MFCLLLPLLLFLVIFFSLHFSFPLFYRGHKLLRNQKYNNGRRDFQGESLRGCNFKNQDLSGADLSGCDIRGANFSGANLTEAKFEKAKAGLRKRSAIFLLLVALILIDLSENSQPNHSKPL